MKKIAACLLALLLCMSARAEIKDDYFTSNAGLYYHYNARCGGEDGRVPISAEAAEAFGKFACPVCFPAENDVIQKPAAVSRGGTIAVRFSDAWINEKKLYGVFGFMGQEKYSGNEAHDLLAQYLHGEDYNAFMEEVNMTGSAQGRVNTPYILPSDGTRIMSRRHIGSDWYIIVRPDSKFAKKWKMYWRVSSLHLQMEGDTLATEFDQQTVEKYHTLELESMNDSVPDYTRENDALAIEVYNALGSNIAVIREKNNRIRTMQGVRLIIGSRDEGIELNGYADGQEVIYCCMLTDAELEQLKGNARAELWHTEAVNSDIFRVNGEDAYDYYSRITDELLFTISKANGADPVDDDFRLTFGGEPDCFVVNDGVPSVYRYLNSGRESIAVQDAAGMKADRITPLFWFEEGGVFLAEAHKYKDADAYDRLFENGIEFDKRFGSAPEDEWASYLCWLVDDRGSIIGDFHNQAFTIHENGTVTFETVEGDEWICDPRAFLSHD